MKNLLLITFLIIIGCGGGGGGSDPAPAEPVHLYVLAGQSNMNRMPIEYFSKWMPQDSIIVKSAVNGTSIKEWVDVLYQGILDQLPADYDTMTLVWMQGERDATLGTSPEEYKRLFRILFEKICADSLVIGRINTYYRDKAIPIRQAQVELAIEYDGEWVNTDDLGDDLHFNDYETLGKRFAESCLSLHGAQ